jgi:hypothetical protein
MYKRFLFCLGLFALRAVQLFPQDLSVRSSDLRIERRTDGIHLFIRKKPDISSVLLTESTRDPGQQADNFAYRAAEWNAVNGNELRVIEGLRIAHESRIYSIIDSSPEEHPELGAAFHLLIPPVLIYGYENTRHGEVYVRDGVYINIRSFALPYGDYRGPFRDNPYRLQAVPREPPPPEGYMGDTVRAFSEISSSGQGELIYSAGPDDLVDKIREVLEQEKGKGIEIVLCLDTTSSMKNDIDSVREKLIPMISDMIADFNSFKIGMVLYKDYFDEYLNQVVPFTGDFAEFQATLNNIRVSGGRDIPEAVYEALYEAAVQFAWEADSRSIILIGDAPPHPRPRGKITREMVDGAVRERGIKVNAIILPSGGRTGP